MVIRKVKSNDFSISSYIILYLLITLFVKCSNILPTALRLQFDDKIALSLPFSIDTIIIKTNYSTNTKEIILAYIHERTYEISILNKKHDSNFFHVDDLLAIPIQILNRKGYHTHVCCEGHPFVASPELDILFYDNVDLPYLPEGFIFKHCRLKFIYKTDSKSVYYFTKEKVSICESLNNWANGLPVNPIAE